jgi:hypothetical protein
MNARTPKEIWQRPRFDILIEKRYKQDEPPFDPFPEVQHVINADFCPIASVHDLLYGSGNATMILAREDKVENLFHSFISNLKNEIGRSDYPVDLQYIIIRFEEYARYEDNNIRRACGLYLESWLYRKLKELANIKGNDKIFFEISVANAKVPFKIGAKTRSYPLYGHINELDFTKKRIIERTIRGDPADDFPPISKDFQVWLLWKTLVSIEKEHYPKAWKGTDFNDFELIVETPYGDFPVEKNVPDFERKAVEAYTWISDITKERRATGEAWRSRACTIKNKKECGLAWSCYGKTRARPTSRSEMRQHVGIFYRPLLWEQMWEHHLLRYQLTMLPEKTQKKFLGKYISIGKVVKEDKEKIVLEIENGIAPALERRINGENSCTVVFGSFMLGIEREAIIESMDPAKKQIVVRLPKRGKSPSSQVKVLFPDMSVVTEGPWFLKRITQKEMYKLEKWGYDNPKRADANSVIRMMECIFGEDVIKMGGERGQSNNRRD